MNQTATQPQPYHRTQPGDLITADLFNKVQVDTKEDIAKQVRAAVDAHQLVERAKNADHLEGKSADEIARDVVEKLKALVPGLTGHRVVFKRLSADEPSLIRHELGNYPLVDLYELERFPVVASADGRQWVENVHWFLYHRTEMKIRRPEGAPDGTPPLITIEESRGPVFKRRFEDVLLQYEVRYDGQTALGDVVNELWKALFSDPNDPFDETSYANSPWFDRCCGDRRTVESLRRGGEWNDLYLKVVPRKSVNSIAPVWPLGVEVVHYDRDTLGLARADFARLSVATMNTLFENESKKEDGHDRVPAPVEADVPREQVPEKDMPLQRAPGAMPPVPSVTRPRTATAAGETTAEEERPDTVDGMVRWMERKVHEAGEARGLPAIDELYLMVLLKV